MTIVRDEEPRSLAVFDFADTSAITGKRESSSTADQALYMMNNRFVLQQSESFARRIENKTSSRKGQIDYAFLLTFSRPPTAGERAAISSFIQKTAPTTSWQNTLVDLCQSLFASAEFRYVD